MKMEPDSSPLGERKGALDAHGNPKRRYIPLRMSKLFEFGELSQFGFSGV
jgi:hypothetical protein